MTSPALLRVDRLSLSNFRCFEECTIDLHPQLTVLVAENGRGKTAILDAIRIALGLFVDTIAGTLQSRGFEPSDVHLVRDESGAMRPVLSTEFIADGQVAGQPLSWSRAIKGDNPRARTSTKNAGGLRDVVISQQVICRASVNDE